MRKKIWLLYITLLAILIVLIINCTKDESRNVKEIEFNSTLSYGTVVDVEGNIYKTIKIGKQTWMAENLKTTKYNNGSSIPEITEKSEWEIDKTGAYCWYNNDKVTYSNVYGALYNWYTVDEGNLCPTGWHVPSAAEWNELTNYLGGENAAGGKLKETNTSHWENPNSGATNESGFTALPGGGRSDWGYFQFINQEGYWWSITNWNIDSTNAWRFSLESFSNESYIDVNSKSLGFSIRCIEDTI